ncbi:MAG: hypothetical protein OEW08_10560, partial [Gammaproteobacteria bacterium]|nr:hypothetical protein [Gammaproteobacteria bacterium]
MYNVASALSYLRVTTLICASLAFAGCQDLAQTTQRISVDNDPEQLGSRVSYQQTVVSIDTSQVLSKTGPSSYAVASAPAQDVTLALVAEVSPPTINGLTLQATEVRVLGNRAYVTYNYQGDTFAGGIEVFDISRPSAPKLVSSALFDDTDVNGVAIQGDTLYLASATSNSAFSSPAILEVMNLQGGLLTSSSTVIGLPSYAGTDVDIAGNYIYVTSGAANGVLSIFSRNDLNLWSRVSIDDARGVDADSEAIAVVAGTPGRIHTHDYTTGIALSQYNLTGATIPNSKSTVEIKQGKAFLGMGDGGAQIICLDTGVVMATINPPVIAAFPPERTVTNAVTAYKRAMFIANGEAGVYVALADQNFNANRCVVNNLTVVGKLQFAQEQSVNHIVYRADMLFVASGLGGV